MEESPPGDDFLARVCAGWEREAARAAGLGLRVAVVRTGVTLGAGGGALAKMLPPFRLGLGGVIGSGRQWLSWVHVDDVCGIYRMAIDGAQGPLNACCAEPGDQCRVHKGARRRAQTPDDSTNAHVRAARAARRGSGDRAARPARLPRRTRELGYRFEFPELKGARANLL